MRIALNAHLLSNQAGYRSAGIHGYISNLLRHLPQGAPAAWQFTALVGAGVKATFPGLHITRARIDTQAPLRRILWEQTAQPGQLRQFDLYHALAFAAPLLLTTPMVVTVYDLSFLRFPARLSAARRLYLRTMTALTCARARRVLAISQSTADDLTALLGVPARKIDVTPLAYDRDLFRPLPPAQIDAFRQRQNLPARFWLFLGTLEPRKNLPLLLQAYASLGPSERLPLLLGGGLGWGADTVFAAIERYGLGDSVKHIGFLPTADLPFWYNAAEAFIYPSVFEGFGLPVLEAMACGTPALTSAVSSLPEVAGEAGKCLTPTDLEAWTAALAQVAQDSDGRAAARAKGLRRAQLFSWARTAELTRASYRKALAEQDFALGESERAARLESK